MAEPTIDDYVDEAVEHVERIAQRSGYHGDKLQSLIDILTNRLLDLPYNLDHE